MSLEVRPVASAGDLRRFVGFPLELYRNHPCHVPQLIRDEIATLSPGVNPAFAEAEAQLFLAWRGGRVVGRVAAILSHAANRKYGTRNLRFGWFDTVEDPAVAAGLFAAVEAWGRERGMETLTGPHGFVDLDPAGTLIEGFEEPGTIATLYNYPYYPALIEGCGFAKEIDYFEFRLTFPAGGVDPKWERMARWAAERHGFRLVRYGSVRQAKREREAEVFELIDELYGELYGTVPLTAAQRRYYSSKYLSYLDPDFLRFVVDGRNRAIGFVIALRSLAGAFRKARGRLLPTGFLHLLRARRSAPVLEFVLGGVRREYRGQGADLLMAVDILRTAAEKGIRAAESNPELETNLGMLGEWKVVDFRRHKRRRIYRKRL